MLSYNWHLIVTFIPGLKSGLSVGVEIWAFLCLCIDNSSLTEWSLTCSTALFLCHQSPCLPSVWMRDKRVKFNSFVLLITHCKFHLYQMSVHFIEFLINLLHTAHSCFNAPFRNISSSAQWDGFSLTCEGVFLLCFLFLCLSIGLKLTMYCYKWSWLTVADLSIPH